MFGDDIDEGVAGLSRDAGPPDKDFEHLRALAQLAATLRRGDSLGTTVVKWLEVRNVSASNESESTRTTPREMQRRSWHDGRRRRPFQFHTKPSNSSRSDRCVRIYFDWDLERRVVVIGWVGRHPRTTGCH